MTEEEFWAALTSLPESVPPVYRLYYNDTGAPLFYSMEELPGKYITVDQHTYSIGPCNVRVIDGILHTLKTNPTTKLIPGHTGTACHPQDISVIVNSTDSHIKWTLK